MLKKLLKFSAAVAGYLNAIRFYRTLILNSGATLTP
jgi:hypothetical protein